MATKLYDTARGRRIYHWLRRNPPLARIVGVDEGDQEVTVSLERNAGLSGQTKWRDAIVALYECVKLRGLNDKGDVVRVLTLDADTDATIAEATDEHENRVLARHSAKESGSTLIAVDVPKLVESIAKNMQEVARSSAEQQANAFKSGFDAMTNVINLCLGMLQRVDQRLEELEQTQPEADEADEPEPNRNALVEQALQQALANNGAPAAAAGVNPQQAVQLSALLQQYLGGGARRPQPEPNGHAGQ